MIHGISANKSSFQSVTFTAGLNVVLAKRADASTQKDTRNGLGKSTLIDIIDFCLGSRTTKGKGLIIEPLEEWAFTIEITLAGNRVTATRAIATPNRIVINGSTTGWVEQPDLDGETGERIFNWERWKILLGWSLFGLPRTNDSFKYKPKYRSLISYFIRRGPNAYVGPFHHFGQQKTWDIQLHTAYLLGLNWEYASQWQVLKDQEEYVKAITKAIKTGAMEGAVGSVGELEAQVIQLEQVVKNDENALISFKVHPQYEGIQADADRITSELHELTNQNVSDRRRLARYQASISEERPPNPLALEKLYNESGLVFSDVVKRTLSEAKEFHEKIVFNRRDFLQTETERIEKVINERSEHIKKLTDERAVSLDILRTHGALQEMTKLQERNVTIKGKLNRVQSRIREVKDLRIRKRDLKIAKTELARLAELDHEQRRDVWSAAVRLFNEHSQALYERPGKLVIDIGDTGYKYRVEIERSGSEGIDKMKIFCFDLALLHLQRKKQGRIDFRIHDTLMYDAVDPRQRARALERAAQVTTEGNAQYICTMNSDMIPYSDFPEGFDFDQHVRLVLTDATPAGSLLGMRFERPNN
ncbi:MAG: DUF2326 domain-containing protein [Deltaproteobacteria bacterium]|nr:DUF2326 domain-containing protein [Deltaproteobacteria bacterium]